MHLWAGLATRGQQNTCSKPRGAEIARSRRDGKERSYWKQISLHSESWKKSAEESLLSQLGLLQPEKDSDLFISPSAYYASALFR